MLWFKKKQGPTVAVSKRLSLRNPSPDFVSGFALEAKRQGREVGNWTRRRADIVLVIGKNLLKEKEEAFRKQGAKFVLRLDGIGTNDPRDPTKDNDNFETYSRMDSVIFQSQFCSDAWKTYLGSTKPSDIIYNGADEKIFSREGARENFGFKRFLVTAARWREWKNLKQMLEVFDTLSAEDKELGFVVIGEGAEIPKHPRIVAPGKLGHQEMAKVFRAADLFLYLPWFEWCPKVVCQALVAGLPVVCSFKGGTRELVSDCGMVVHGAKDDGFTFSPNPVNVDEAVKAVRELLEKKERIRPRPDLHLSVVVEEYFKVFEKVLDHA